MFWVDRCKARSNECVICSAVDGTGLGGSCRVAVAGQIMAARRDEPAVDGHPVNCEELARRGKRFEREERESLRRYQPCRHTATPA